VIRYFSKKNKCISIILSILFIFTPFIPVYSAELNSTSYNLQEYNLGSGNESNSTNFSITGTIDQSHTGLFSVSNLPLAPGVISSCGKITTAGTYTLAADLIGISGTCFSIQADNVIIDGDGHSVIAAVSNTNYAITATSSVAGGSAYGTTTIQDITFSGFWGGINASGNNATSGNTNGGDGGEVSIINSTIGSSVTSSGLGSGTGSAGLGGYVIVDNSTTGNITNTGTGGIITLIDDDLNISNSIYTTSGTFSITYTGILTPTNTTISSVSNFVVNGTNYGSYVGGAFPIIPGTITSCGTLYFSGTYTFGSNITGNCTVAKTGVTIDGNSNTLTGNISAGTFGVTLSNIDVTGSVSTTGAGAGALTVNNASNLTGTISVTGQISGDGSSSLGNTTISAGGSVATSSVSFVGTVTNSGTIGPNNAVAGKITNSGTINTGGGTFSFNASSTNSGTVNGSAILSASSTNSGTITGDATFDAYTAVSGTVNFSGATVFSGTGYVNGTIYDLTGINEINTWVFNGSSINGGILKGDAVFNDSSKNATSSIVIGNAEFRGTSLNQGTVTGNSDVYSPVTRPLGGITNGSVIYHEYAGLYFNDTAVGHGTTGKWDDINNWWLDSGTTSHSPVLPTAGDNVIISAGTISTTTAPASVYTAIFQGNSVNGITLTVNSTARDAALFNASSTNNGTIIGNATFAGTGSVNNGTVTGYITRQYSTGIFTIIEDFTHNGVHWIVQAINGATVDLTGATYSLVTNIFEALSNSTFIWNTLIGGGIPDLEVHSPVSGTNIKWNPDVSWDTTTLCQYKFDSDSYASVDCSLDGSDIPRPTAGAHTLFVKSTDANGNVTEQTVVFTYDNTQPVDTDCSVPLDEATRPYYYLSSNVGSCTITASTTLRGDDGLGNYYSATSLTGSSTTIILENITVTGTVSGFSDIDVASSTLSGTLSINGVFTADTLSTFGSTTVTSFGEVNGGTFTGNMTNNGVINISTTTPVTVVGSLTNNGTIQGSITLNSSSVNLGTINGNVILNGSSVNRGIVNGDLTFSTLTASSNRITFEGDTVFQGTGTTTGAIYDNQNQEIDTWIFNDTSTNLRFTQGLVFFNDSSSNLGTVKGDAYFNDSSTNSGTIIGNAYRYKAWLIAHALGGTVTGNTTYYSYPNSASFRNISGDNNWNNVSNWFMFATTTIPLGRIPISGEDIVLFASTTLKSNLTNDIYMGVDDVALNGGYYTLTGNIYGNGAYGGFDAYDFNLLYITVTGTTSSMGGDGYSTIDGGNGGNIDVRYSTTGVITVNGGDPEHDGGDAGTIYVFNSIGIEPNTNILAVGGAAAVCGFGGSGGNVTLQDTDQYVVNVQPGQDATATIAQGGGCANPPSGSSGTYGQTSNTGTFNPTLNSNPNSTPNNNNNNTNNNAGTSAQGLLDRLLPIVKFNLPQFSDLDLRPLPMFGTGLGDTFSFINRIKNFFTARTFEQIKEKFYPAPNLLSYLKINTIYDIVNLKQNPKRIQDTKQKGLFTLYVDEATKPLTAFVTSNSNGDIIQLVRVHPSQNLVISLIPTVQNPNYEGVFDGEKIKFENNKFEITAPEKPGIYELSTYASPILLHIEVLDQNMFDKINSNIFILIIQKIMELVKNFYSLILFRF
jgi:hypothetical protein